MVPRFKFGDVREDGYIYVGKRYDREDRGDWRSPEAYEKYKERNRIKKKKKYDEKTFRNIQLEKSSDLIVPKIHVSNYPQKSAQKIGRINQIKKSAEKIRRKNPPKNQSKKSADFFRQFFWLIFLADFLAYFFG